MQVSISGSGPIPDDLNHPTRVRLKLTVEVELDSVSSTDEYFSASGRVVDYSAESKGTSDGSDPILSELLEGRSGLKVRTMGVMS